MYHTSLCENGLKFRIVQTFDYKCYCLGREGPRRPSKVTTNPDLQIHIPEESHCSEIAAAAAPQSLHRVASSIFQTRRSSTKSSLEVRMDTPHQTVVPVAAAAPLPPPSSPVKMTRRFSRLNFGDEYGSTMAMPMAAAAGNTRKMSAVSMREEPEEEEEHGDRHGRHAAYGGKPFFF